METRGSKKQRQYLIVGALDFGTSYSGYAFSYSHDPSRVFTRPWFSSSRGIRAEKTPTCILFDKNKTFSTFGFKAEEDYGRYCDEAKNSGDEGENSSDEGENYGDEAKNSGDDGKKCDWYFFRGYKLDLYDEMCLKQDKMIKDELGRDFSLFDIVTETLRYLNDELIKDCEKRQDKFTERDMLRVITVPAIWSDSARHFMRKAAEKAGIPADLINICLEPEAAAIYCRTVPCKSSNGDGESKLLNFQPGQQYLVFDAGGGTVDIVIHEVEESGHLKELHPACGSDCGGTMVDRAFIDFISECLGKEAFSKFRRTEIYDFMDFMREFENKKRSVETEYSNDADVLFRVPISLQIICRASVSEGQYQHAERTDFSLKNDKMRLQYERVLSFFSGSKEIIYENLSDLFAQSSLRGVDTIIMVGGFSDSLVVQNFMVETFKTKTVIIPNEPGSAVLQGAVIFGHDPSVIAERRCRYTYGIGVATVFDDKLHKVSKRFTGEDGTTRAKDVFSVHVKVGQNVKSGVYQPALRYTPLRKDQKSLLLPLYASPRPDPLYIDEDDCKEINSRSIDISELQGAISDKVVEVSLCFSEPLITIRAEKQQTGEEITHRVHYNWSTDDPSGHSEGAGLIKLDPRELVICAMTFGLSTCSCTLAFMHDSRHISVPLSQDIKHQGRQSACVLYDREENYNAFGFEAEEKYEDKKNIKEDWLFFKDYKKALYGKHIFDRQTKIKDALGREFALFKVIKETIRYLKTETCTYLNTCLPCTLQKCECHYVLIVPNTFTDSANQFLAESAEEADIPREQLVLCSEAVAVAAYCQSVPCKRLSGSAVLNHNSMSLDPTQTYVICNGGNHWVSFTAIKVDDSGHVQVIRDMGSGEWGLKVACDSFSKFLHNVFGDEAMAEAERSDKEELYEVINDFKWKSHTLSMKSDLTEMENLKIPASIRRSTEQKALTLRNEVTFVTDKMRFSRKRMLDFHMVSLKQIAKHLFANLNGSSTSSDVSTIILVDEYAECLVLQEYLADRFPRMAIIVPDLPSAAVSRGSILHVESCRK